MSTRATTAATAPPLVKKQRTTAASDTKMSATAATTPAATAIAAGSSDGAAAPLPSTLTATTSSTSSASKAMAKAKFCINCQKELARNIRITCVECVAPLTKRPLIELCVECFAVGTELGDHKKTHKYSVSDCLAFPVVRESLTRDDAVAATATPASTVTTAATAVVTPQKGSSTTNGSTTTAATATTTPKTTPAATAPAPLPLPTALLTTDWTADEELLLLEGIEMFGMGNWKDISEFVATKSEKKCESHYMGAYLSASDLMPRFLDDPIDPIDVDAQTTTSPVKPKTTSTTTTPHVLPPPLATKSTGSELAGYMPLRGDFDVEYDNEAELIVADMEFGPDDHPTERALKLQVLAIYNAKLDERERRKRFVVAHGLLDYKRHQHAERRRPKDERELVAQMRPFARFQTPDEHETFVAGLLAAMRLRKQIVLLQEYRKHGVRTLAEAELYDADRKKRETEQALQKQRDGAAYLYETHRPASSSRDRASRWLNRESDGTSGASSNEHHGRTRGGAAVGGDPSGAASGTTSGGGAAASLIDGAPGCHLLTPHEKELCAKLKLLPKHYLVIKDALIRECFRLGFLTKKSAKEIVKIDVNKTGHIYDFFVKCGWVTTEATAPKMPPSTKATGAAATNGSAVNGTPSAAAVTASPAMAPALATAAAATTTESAPTATTAANPADPTSSTVLAAPMTTASPTESSVNAATPLKRKASEMSAADEVAS